ncbi:hypothetical protein KCTC52924_00838 [Arenibacter antarcticus]|uniref:Uncharacterized protein n=1 Tax=Arenibacter antarcticus TaxID=2040469 RepID=A0ABW5VDM8_9FLAO|nr:hypothetical protein [Arenibacter sp. H213]
MKANGEHFENGAHLIPVNVLTVKVNESSKIKGTSNPIVISTQGQTLISSAGRGSKLNIDLDYSIPEARSASTDILGKAAGKFTQMITYTVSALYF